MRLARWPGVRYAQGMDGQISRDAAAATLVATALEGRLSDAQAEQLAALDPTLQKLAWLAATQRIAEQDARIAELGVAQQ